jgi:hypothetical protein
MIDFKNKYLKYKKKYLNLKKGGVLFSENQFIDNFENEFIKNTDAFGKLSKIYISETFTLVKNQKYSIDYDFTYSERNNKHSLKIGIIYDDDYLVDVEFSDEYILPFDEIYKSDNPYDISKKLFMEIYNKYEDFFDEVIKYNELFESITIGGVKKNKADRFRKQRRYDETIGNFIDYIEVEVYDDLYSYTSDFDFNKVNDINLELRIKLFGRSVYYIKEKIQFNELLNKGKINDIEKKIINIIQKYILNNKKKIKEKLFDNYFSTYKDFKFFLEEKKKLDQFKKILNKEKENKLIFTHETRHPIKLFKSRYIKGFREGIPIPINTKLNLNDKKIKDKFIKQAETNIFTQILKKNPGGDEQIVAAWFYEYENIKDNFFYLNSNIERKLEYTPPGFTKFRMILMIPREDVDTEYYVYFNENDNKNLGDKDLPIIEYIDINKENLITRLKKINSSVSYNYLNVPNEDLEKNIYKITSKVARSFPGTITQFDVSINYVKLIIADISMKKEIDENFDLFKNINIVYTSHIIDYE